MFDIEEKILDVFCLQFNDKLKSNESYEEYISSFKKDELERLLKINAVILDDNSKFARVISVSSHKKNNVVEEFKKSIKEIYTNILKNVDEDVIIQLENYLKRYKNEIFEYNFVEKYLSLHFIEFLNVNCIAKIKYSKSDNKLYLYTPVEIRNILKEILKDKSIKKSSKENKICKSNLYNLMSTYGVITLDKLLEIYNQVYKKISRDELYDLIMLCGIFDGDIRITKIDDGYLVYNMEFEDEDHALEFYYSITDDIDYKIYTKEEYDEIGEGSYHYNFLEFEKLDSFLQLNLGMDDEEAYMFDQMFVLDYLYSYQIDNNEAKRNLDINLKRDFSELNIIDKSFICKTILAIAKNYPNYNYRGYSYNEARELLDK